MRADCGRKLRPPPKPSSPRKPENPAPGNLKPPVPGKAILLIFLILYLHLPGLDLAGSRIDRVALHGDYVAAVHRIRVNLNHLVEDARFAFVGFVVMLMVPVSPGSDRPFEYDALRHEHEVMTRVTTSGTVPSLVKVNSRTRSPPLRGTSPKSWLATSISQMRPSIFAGCWRGPPQRSGIRKVSVIKIALLFRFKNYSIRKT